MHRTPILIATLAAAFTLGAVAQSFDPNSPEAGYPKQVEPALDGHGSNSPSRRAFGPLITRQYASRIDRPPAHGYTTADFETLNGKVDSFRYRATLRVVDKDGTTEIVYRDVKRIEGGREVDVLDFEVTTQMDDNTSETPTSVIFEVSWREVRYI